MEAEGEGPYRAGQLVADKYRLIRRIGEGGMASVWAARHDVLGRTVALKIARCAGNGTLAGRFQREARAVGGIEHENVVRVLDAGELPAHGDAYLAMELLAGQPLSALLEPMRPLGLTEVLPVALAVCRGLAATHDAGIIHRDVKPENIFLAHVVDRIVPKIVDFGISFAAHEAGALTLDGQVLGTPAYMSPEQAIGGEIVTARSDLWALGVVLYEALAARQPFATRNPLALLRSIIDDDPPPLPDWVDAEARAIVMRCLEKDPTARYATAAALGEDLQHLADRFGIGELAVSAVVVQDYGLSSEPDAKRSLPTLVRGGGTSPGAARGRLARGSLVATALVSAVLGALVVQNMSDPRPPLLARSGLVRLANARRMDPPLVLENTRAELVAPVVVPPARSAQPARAAPPTTHRNRITSPGF